MLKNVIFLGWASTVLTQTMDIVDIAIQVGGAREGHLFFFENLTSELW
jgi:hypothetical protein